jgi:RHS repeat-associated protein
LESTGDVNNNITYAGYQYDEETGLYYLNARMYDPKIARFLQEDTYRGDPMDPLSLNLYAYCAYNPIMYYDPTGHFSIFSGDDWRKLARNIKEVTIGITDGTMRFISGNAYQSVGSFVGDVRWAFNNREYLTDGTITYFSETASNIKQGIVGFVSDVKWAYKNRDIVAETINESIQQYKADVKWAIDNRDIVAETTKDMAKQAVHYFNNKSMREKIAIITDVTLNIASFIGVPEAAAAKLTQLKKVDKLVDTVNLVDKLYDAGAGMRRLDNVLDATNMIDDLYNAGRGMKQLDRVADTVTALRKSDRLVEASTGIRFMDNIDDFGRVGIPELPKNAIQKNYLEVTRRGNKATSGVGGNTPKTLLPGEGNVGTYKELVKGGSRGDNITPHHMPSAEYMKGNYNVPKNNGVSMNMEQPVPGSGGRHRMTRSYGNGSDLTEAPRDALARDIMDARKVYQNDGLYTPSIRRSLQEVIEMNKRLFPEIFRKAGR